MVTGTGAARRARAVAAGSAWVMAAAGGAHAQATGAATTPPAGAAAAVLPAIDVTGKGNRASSGLVGLRTTAGTKTDTPVAEIPQTINP
ncbi:TonB-dependent siderophore receptor, partial [Alcaligenes phenolicus]